jgi:hypothetical protein
MMQRLFALQIVDAMHAYVLCGIFQSAGVRDDVCVPCSF